MLRLVTALVTALATVQAPASGVVTEEYHLGETTVLGFRNEMSAVVHHPSSPRRKHPVVVMLHGWFATCADRAAGDAYEAAWQQLYGRTPTQDPAERERQRKIYDDAYAQLFRWPCAPGVAPLPSFRGYDYLGKQLAQQGFVVVSISANGINGKSSGQDEFAGRAALINEHLKLWRDLGQGPLAAQFPSLIGRVDMWNVGVLGHSKGGRAVARHSADEHRGEWPNGVSVKAVLALEPIISGGSDNLVTKVPFLSVIGACDNVSNPLALSYFRDGVGRNTAPRHQLMVHGANHNFFNTQWSPSSGQINAEDDAYNHARPPYPQEGNCRTTDDAAVEEKQLTEQGQRMIGGRYVSAFFQRYLMNDLRFERLLNGQERVPGIDVEYAAPVS